MTLKNPILDLLKETRLKIPRMRSYNRERNCESWLSVAGTIIVVDVDVFAVIVAFTTAAVVRSCLKLYRQLILGDHMDCNNNCLY